MSRIGRSALSSELITEMNSMIRKIHTERFIANQWSHYQASGRKDFYTERVNYRDAYNDCIDDIKKEFVETISKIIESGKTYTVFFDLCESKGNGVTVIDAECMISII